MSSCSTSTSINNSISSDDIFKLFFADKIPSLQEFKKNISNINRPCPIIKNITINLKQAFFGCNYPFEIERWIICNETNLKQFEKEKIYVEIHPGIDSKEIIIIPEKGNIINNDNKGDIKIFINVENNEYFERNGMDLIYKKQITLKEALTGFQFDIKHINGKIYTVNSDNGLIITPNYKKIIPYIGMCRGKKMGNLIIAFNEIYPYL